MFASCLSSIMNHFKRQIFVIFFILALNPVYRYELFSKNTVSPYLYPSRRDDLLYEVGDIVFEGNNSFKPAELMDAVTSQRNTLSIQHDIFQYYYDNLKRIPETPKVIIQSLNTALNNLSHEIKYFNENTAEIDLQTLWHFYNTNGFHYAEISYAFYPDSNKKYNVLKFTVSEHTRFLMDTIVYIGFDSLDRGVADKIQSFKTIRKGDTYNEQKIMNEVNGILNLLLNNGYYYAELEVEPVIIKTDIERDSVTVIFKPGKRQRIAHLNFVDSLNNQLIVVDNMKRLQLDFKEGDWYSRKQVQTSINNLHTLGTFELVSIDTSSIFFPITDTTISMLIFTKYRKQKEWGIGFFVNNTQVDYFTNVGIEANIMHRNWGGAAQTGNIFANVSSKNISRIFAGQTGEYEGQAGLRLAQPLIWSIENMRIGVNGSFYYSYSTVDRLFEISAWYLPIRFPIKLTNETFINQIIIDFNFEFQNPVNYIDVIRDNDTVIGEPARFEQSMRLYTNLYNYLSNPGITLLTSNLFGITLIGDTRNHPFNPTAGNNFYFSVDGWNVFLPHPWISGTARFLRAQSSYTLFLPMIENVVSAFKFKAGVIKLFDDVNAFVPFDRQFFSGGANSVRGWLSRELHYSTNESAEYSIEGRVSDYVLPADEYTLLSNVVGSAAIIEGSYEFRYSLPMLKGINETLAYQVSNIGLTFFIDYGNAYHWYTEVDNRNKMEWYEYLTKMAWAAGFGIRYNTPIGPLRLDFGFPIYRPGNNVPDYHIWDDSSIFRDMKLHFGIGHAF